jgi:hypothetical protein
MSGKFEPVDICITIDYYLCVLSKDNNEVMVLDKLYRFGRDLKVDRGQNIVSISFKKKRKIIFDKKELYVFKFLNEGHLEKFLLEYEVHRRYVNELSD